MQDNNDILSQFSQNAAQRAANLNQSLDIDAQKRAQAAQGGGFITNDQIAADQAAKDQQQAQQPDANAQTTPQPGQGDGNGGNWFTKALPTIGSIAAPILGALLAPETGGASLLAGLALASAGSGAGKLGENALEGKKDLGEGVGGAALEGGIGQAVGGAAGKLLGGAAGAIGKVADQGIASKTLGTTAEQAFKDAQDIKNVYGAVPSATKQGIYDNQNLKGALDLAKNIGSNPLNPSEYVDHANVALNNLSDIRREVVHAGGPINTAGVIDEQGTKVAPSISDIIESALRGTHPTTGEQVGSDLTSALGSTDLVAGAGKKLVAPNNASMDFINYAKQKLGGLEGNATDPQQLLDASTAIGQDAQNARNLAAKTAESDVSGTNAAKAQAMTALDNHLNDMLYNRPSVDQAVSGLPGVKIGADESVPPQLQDYLNQKIGQATTGKEVNSLMSQFMNLKNQGNEALKVAGDPTNSGAMNALKAELPVDEQAGAVGIPTSKTGLVTTVANKLFNAVGNGGVTSNIASKLANNLTGASAVANKIASRLPEGATPNIAGNYATNAGLYGTLGAQTIAGAPNYQGPAGTGTAVNALDIPQGSGNPFQDILHSNDIASTPAKMAIIDSMFNGAMGNHTSLSDPAIAEYLNKQQSLRNAAAQVNSYIQALNAAGGAQGRVGGLLGQLGGVLTGGPAAALGNQQAAVEHSLSQALGRPVSLPNMQLTQSGANGVLGQLNAALHTQSGM